MESLRELYKIGFGPSSSHTMGPSFASNYFLNLYPNAFRYEVVLSGSLSLTGRGHLTDVKIRESFADRKLEIIFSRNFENLPHPNTMDFFAYDEKDTILGHRRILSVGGGSIRIIGDDERQPKQVYPFADFDEIRDYAEKNHMTLPEIVYQFEDANIKDYLMQVWVTMVNAIDRGITNQSILPGTLKISRKAPTLSHPILPENDVAFYTRTVMCYAYAASEENASGGIIVTAPTCGSGGIIPAVLRFLKETKHLDNSKMIDALAVASLIGNVVKQNASISGAEAGCQAEIGTATAMASAAIAFLEGLSLDQIECSAEVSLEHHLGLTCDPVEGYVQIPCIERNAVCSLRAFDSVNIARYLAQARRVTFDVVVKTMNETGRDLIDSYRETATGGLAKTFGKR